MGIENVIVFVGILCAGIGVLIALSALSIKKPVKVAIDFMIIAIAMLPLVVGVIVIRFGLDLVQGTNTIGIMMQAR